MKRKLFGISIIIAIAIVVLTVNVCISQNKDAKSSDLVLANVEALAGDEDDDKTWTAPRQVPCDFREGPWHTASVEVICEFCVTPNSCTSEACGS